MFSEATPVSLDATFAALADPTRRAILTELASGERTVNELVAPFALTQPAISRHLRVLEEAGLVVTRVDGTRRPRRLAAEGLETIDRWLSTLRQALETNYQRLDDLLAEMNSEGDDSCSSTAVAEPVDRSRSSTRPTKAAEKAGSPAARRPKRSVKGNRRSQLETVGSRAAKGSQRSPARRTKSLKSDGSRGARSASERVVSPTARKRKMRKPK